MTQEMEMIALSSVRERLKAWLKQNQANHG